MAYFKRLIPSKNFFFQAGTAGCLAATSDVACQLLVEKRSYYDLKRTIRFALITSCVIAPIQFNWFRFLSTRIQGNNLQTGIKRMLVDQAFAAPLLTSAFICTINFVDSGSFQSAFQRTKELIVPVMKTNYKVWPVVQVVNMTFVPLSYRVIFLQFVSIFWNIYLSFMANN